MLLQIFYKDSTMSIVNKIFNTSISVPQSFKFPAVKNKIYLVAGVCFAALAATLVIICRLRRDRVKISNPSAHPNPPACSDSQSPERNPDSPHRLDMTKDPIDDLDPQLSLNNLTDPEVSQDPEPNPEPTIVPVPLTAPSSSSDTINPVKANHFLDPCDVAQMEYSNTLLEKLDQKTKDALKDLLGGYFQYNELPEANLSLLPWMHGPYQKTEAVVGLSMDVYEGAETVRVHIKLESEPRPTSPKTLQHIHTLKSTLEIVHSARDGFWIQASNEKPGLPNFSDGDYVGAKKTVSNFNLNKLKSLLKEGCATDRSNLEWQLQGAEIIPLTCILPFTPKKLNTQISKTNCSANQDLVAKIPFEDQVWLRNLLSGYFVREGLTEVDLTALPSLVLEPLHQNSYTTAKIASIDSWLYIPNKLTAPVTIVTTSQKKHVWIAIRLQSENRSTNPFSLKSFISQVHDTVIFGQSRNGGWVLLKDLNSESSRFITADKPVDSATEGFKKLKQLLTAGIGEDLCLTRWRQV
jgi:hypothetical protein